MNCANHPDRDRQAFCQNCGKPLCRECARVVGQAVFCEPCLEARLAGAIPVPGPYTPNPGPAAYQAAYQTVPGAATPYPAAPGYPAAPRPGTPNPAVAAVLGFIPGVGAMYNGQYAKGIVHLIVFAILVSLADQNSIFGIFVTAWLFYQAVEAYHTARARRDGTPLPNPFGLNDIGERFGFGRAWPGVAAAPPAPPAPPAANPYAAPEPPPAPEQSPYTAPPPAWTTTTTPDPLRPNPIPSSPSLFANLPVGAVVLIALGLLFLVGNTHWLGRLPLQIILPALLIGVGVWLFIRRMTGFGGFVDDGSPAYRLRVLSAVQGSVWIVLVGILFLLDSLHILSWDHSWPLFIIVAGVLIFLRRATAATLAAGGIPVAGATGYVPPTPYTPTAAAPVPPPSETERL